MGFLQVFKQKKNKQNPTKGLEYMNLNKITTNRIQVDG